MNAGKIAMSAMERPASCEAPPTCPQKRPVVIATYDLRASGTVVKALEIAAALTSAGIRTEIWSVRATGALIDRVPPGVVLREIGATNVRAPGRAVDLALNLPRLALRLRSTPPAVFLSSGNHFHLPAGLAVWLSGRKRALRYGVRISNSSRRGRSARRGPDSWQARFSAMKFMAADFGVAVSDELADEVRVLKSDLRLRSIPNGVDIERVRIAAEMPFAHPFLFPVENRPKAPVLVTMGRLCHQKGYDLLIRALARVRQSCDVRLLIIGGGSDQAKAGLQGLAETMGVADSVDFLGYLSNPFAVMRRCDVYINSSRWEGFSNALLEAMACGLKLVATDCPTGNRELIAGGAHGTLAMTENEASLAESILAEIARDRDPVFQIAAAQERSLVNCMESWVAVIREQLALS